MARCGNHADREAGRACAGCGKPLCDECVELVEEGAAYCYDCAVDRQLAEFRGRETEAKAEREDAGAGKRRVGSRGFLAVAVATSLLIAGAVGFILYKHFALNAAPAQGSPQEQETWSGDECIADMQEVRLALRAYREEHGNYPSSLDALGGYLEVEPACPATGAPYVYVVTGTGFELSCPNPQAHGSESIRSSDASVPVRDGGTASGVAKGG